MTTAVTRTASIALRATDGCPLGATHFGARGESRGSVVIGGAAAVRRRYYAPFAEWISEHGFDVLTFDYRGIGESRVAPGSAFPLSASAWGELDLDGALRWAEERAGAGDVAYVGHSIGGQLLGLAASNEIVKRALFVGVQSGDYRLWPALLPRVRMAANWYLVVPGLATLYGYVPGKLGMGEDLPAGVAFEWARWGRTNGYLLGGDGARRIGGFDRVRIPLRALAISDDRFAPRTAVDAMLGAYRNARVDLRIIGPSSVRGAPVGHFGFFRERFRTDLWPMARVLWERAVAANASRTTHEMAHGQPDPPP